jgi:hydroxyethylthiazole kinase-like sugar kinase family protein
MTDYLRCAVPPISATNSNICAATLPVRVVVAVLILVFPVADRAVAVNVRTFTGRRSRSQKETMLLAIDKASTHNFPFVIDSVCIS